MDDREIQLVQDSFAKVKPIASMAAEIFYARLFTIAPEVEPLFKGDMTEQGAKLMATLGVVVNGLRDLEALLPAAKDLAARHVTYGVTPAMYQPVGQALIYTLEKGLADDFTDEVEAAWLKAYAVLREAMVASAYPKAGAARVVAAE